MENMQKFVNAMQKKFESYFLACGVKRVGKTEQFVVILDDRDVSRTTRKDLRKQLEGVTNEVLSEVLGKSGSRKAKIYLLSEMNQSSVWPALGDFATILDVKTISNFVSLNLPERFLDAYDLVPAKFKLDDIRKEFEKISGRKYHRNTYQIWLKGLKKVNMIKLSGRSYDKITRKELL